MIDEPLRSRLARAQEIIRLLEDELKHADHGLIALTEELEERARLLEDSERRFRALIENIAEGITVIDPDGAVQFVSAGFERITGYSAEERHGRSVFERVHRDDVERTREAWRRLVAEPGGSLSTEARLQRKDGDWRTIELTGKNLSEDASVGGIIVTYRDVTLQRALEEQLRQAQKMEAVGRLAGGVAHDFNNVLTAVTGYAQFILDDLREGRAVDDDVHEVLRAAERAGDLTRQLLAFSRQQVTTPRVVDLGARIREIERMLRRLIGEDVHLEVAVSPGLARVTVDPTQIEQVVVNLAVNARDAMPAGGRLSIAAENATIDEAFARRFSYEVRTGEYVRLSASDTGSGMDEETIKQVFEPFFTTKERGKGTGLGLSTVYGIIKQAGGYVWVESTVGAGTRFDVYLPCTGEEPAPPETSVQVGELTGTETILVVEDEASVRALARRILERAGYRVLQAESGEEAIRTCERHGEEIELLLTDVVMPQMGGKELVERIHRTCPHIRVLYMSGYSEEQIARRGVVDAGVKLIEKPFGPRDLQKTVRKLLDEPA